LGVAHRLLDTGVSCIVVERLSSDGLCARAKAGMLEHRSVLALEAVGLAEPISKNGGTNGVVEFCVNGVRHAFNYAALTGGRGHYVYPQHLLVRAWMDEFIAKGGRVQFSTEVTDIEVRGTLGVTVQARAPDALNVGIDCRVVVLATGAGAGLVPPEIASHQHEHPFRWLTAMVAMPPLGERTIYAPHQRGFAAHLRRSPELTRYYLQIPARDRLEDWGDQRITEELEVRLGIEGQALIRGPIIERDVVDLRVRVREPMARGPIFLAGDAAHLITPAGGKGMNLAIQDALELAAGLIDQFCAGDGARLSRYSEVRLPVIWRTQEFSNWMLTVFCGGVLDFHRGEPDPAHGFARRLHAAQIERLVAEPAFARWFAHRYAGVDEDGHGSPCLTGVGNGV
jgi:p-hydroxybenzoate 3-monooxygenase